MSTATTPEYLPEKILVRYFMRMFFCLLRERDVQVIFISGQHSRNTHTSFRRSWDILDAHRHECKDIQRLVSALHYNPLTGAFEMFIEEHVAINGLSMTPDGHGFRLIATTEYDEAPVAHLKKVAMLAADAYAEGN